MTPEERKEHNRLRAAKFRAEQPEKYKEIQSRYRESHPEVVRQASKNFKEANPDKVSKWRKNYYESNLKKERSNSKKYYDNHREEIKARAHDNYVKNSEIRKAYSKQYRLDNAEKVKESIAKWRKENAEAYAEIKNRGHALRRARKMGVEYEKFTLKNVLDRWGTYCHICLGEIDLKAPRTAGAPGWETGLHIDHVIALANGGGHTLENCRPSHGICNLRKGTF